MSGCLFRTLLVVLACLVAFTSNAHSVGTSYLFVSAPPDSRNLDVRLDLNLRDVELAVRVDANHDGAITWGELLAARPQLDRYVSTHLVLKRAGRPCVTTVNDLLVNDLSDGSYAVLQAQASCPAAGAISIASALMFDADAQHRTLLNYKWADVSIGTVLSIDERAWQEPSDTERGHWRELGRFVLEGIHHIWIGFDHLAFLFILLLPAVVAVSPLSGRRARRPIARVLVIISAFTAAHSMTLALAVLQIVTLPERAVEVAIAGSVIVAALANLNSRTRDLGPVTAFAFGLLHGFGFANALTGLALGQLETGLALLGFNLGVELGQLAVVAAVLPILHLMRHTRFYVMKVIPAGSVAVAGMGAVWLAQRLAM